MTPDGERLAAHLSASLVEHVRRCARDGVPAPAGFLELAQMLANARQRPPELDGPASTVEPAGMPPEFVDYATAAAVLGVSVRTVSRRVAAGRMPVVGSGTGRRIPAAALIEECS